MISMIKIMIGYNENDEHCMCVDPCPSTEQQIRADAILSRQLQEEQVQLRIQTIQIENNIPCYVDPMRFFYPSQNQTY